jgi:hypothetical protein
LIDDSLSGEWAQAGRRMDTAWFGDMSTYNLAAAAEYLGYYMSVDVAIKSEFNAASLAKYDVVVLKTPKVALSGKECGALLAWVDSGGGLLLIGDHTDLLSTSTHLNRLSSSAGIQFRFDSVSDATTGAFSAYEKPLFGYHPIMGDSEYLEFMTSCSLQLSYPAEPVIVVSNSIRQEGDYAHSSNFGALYSNPSMDHGPLVLAAASKVGRGRVVAFSDSTVLSSFAINRRGRREFLLRAVDYLNRTNSWGASAAALGAAISAAAALISLARLLSRTSAYYNVSLLTLVLLVYQGGIAAGTAVNHVSYGKLHPVRPVPEVEVVASGDAVLPPVLGSLGRVNPDYCYDTLYAALSRIGVFPIEKDGIDLKTSSPVIWINPLTVPPDNNVSELAHWLSSGGRLLILLRSDHVHTAAVGEIVQALGGDDVAVRLASRTSNGTGETRQSMWIEGMDVVAEVADTSACYSRSVGAGKLCVIIGSEFLSRERLGHCFARPGQQARAMMDMFYRAIDSVCPSNEINRNTYLINRTAPNE